MKGVVRNTVVKELGVFAENLSLDVLTNFQIYKDSTSKKKLYWTQSVLV